MSTEQNEVTRAEFARLNGWAKSYVTKLAGQGRLVLTEDGKRVKVAESLELIQATEGGRDDVARRHADERQREAEERHDDSLTAVKLARARDEARITRAKADQEEMQRDQMAGSLIPREEVEFAMNDFGAMLRQLMDGLADRLAPEVYPLTTLEETHARISEAAEGVLREMAETMKRREKEFGTHA